MSEELTRADVRQMIETAIAALKGRGEIAGRTTVQGNEKQSIGIDERGNRVVTTAFGSGTLPPPKQKSAIRLDERGDPFVSTIKIKPQETQPAQPTIAEKRSVLGGGERQATMGRDDVRELGGATGGRSKEAIADQIKATQEKFREKAKADQKTIEDADAKFREAMGNDVTAKVLGAASREYISREEVIALINDAVPSTLRHVGRAATSQATGNFLKLENGAQTAAWVDLPILSSGMDYDYFFVGTTKVTPPTKTTNFLQITLGASPSAAWVAAMPATEGSNTVTIDVTRNRIYLSGSFAG